MIFVLKPQLKPFPKQRSHNTGNTPKFIRPVSAIDLVVGEESGPSS
jgi:hypothetical protein